MMLFFSGIKSPDTIEIAEALRAPIPESPSLTQTEIESSPPTATSNNPPVLTNNPPVLTSPFFSEADARRMNMSELNTELEKRGLSKAGRKQDLLDRLLTALKDNVNIQEESDTRTYPEPGDGFSGYANWIELTADKTPAANPTEEGFRAPTN